MSRDPLTKDGLALPLTAGVAAAALVCIVAAFDPLGLATLARERCFDLIVTAWPRGGDPPKIVVVDFDDASLEALGPWPLPRTRLTALVDKLAAARPAAIGFDIFFAQADRHGARSLAEELDALPGGREAATLARALADSDDGFAAALQRAPTVLGALAAPAQSQAPPLNFIRSDAPLDGRSALLVDGLLGPYPPLATSALAIGVQSLLGEDNGIVRRVPLLLTTGETTAPGLALETVRVARHVPVLEVATAAGRIALGTGAAVSYEAGGLMRLAPSSPERWAARTLPVASVLDGTAPEARFTDAIVLVGASAIEVGALRPTAVSPLTPSIQIQADAVETILQGTAPWRPPRLVRGEWGAILGLGLLAAALATVRGPGLGSLFVLALGGLWLAGVGLAWRSAGLLVDPVWPGLAVLIAGNAAAAVAFARTRRLRLLIGQRFGQYLAPDVVRAIVAEPQRLKREGEWREVTALFTDIEGFTAMTSRIGPQRLIALLNPYLDGICAIVTEHRGMVDLIVGDAVHAFFNMPLDLPDHADRAVACALAIQRFAESFRQRPEAAAAGFGRTRVGIESGPAVVGDVGGPTRFNYTAHGEAANAAARLEAAGKELGTAICIGPGTRERLRSARLRPVGTVQFRGFAAPVEVYTPEEAPVSSPVPAPPQSAPATSS